MEITRNEQEQYKSFDGGINMIHTFVPKSLQSKGYGSALVKLALEHARAYVARHKEYESLL